MIAKLYMSIAKGLHVVKDCTVYQEDVPQNFKTPSFLISFYNQAPAHGINERLKNTVGVDVTYFPGDKVNVNDECWSVGQLLGRELQVEGFKIKNRNMEIVDKVLHLMFDVDYCEYKETEFTNMQTLTQNTEIKED
ncbi:MAG: phage tail terminator family protein [Lachnospiraceae bacterium]